MTVDQYYAALRNQDYTPAYRYLDTNLAATLPLEQFTAMAQGQDAVGGTVSRYSIAPDLAVTPMPLPGESLPLVTFTRQPTQNLIVTVRRTHARSYMVHLKVCRVGNVWAISAFDRI